MIVFEYDTMNRLVKTTEDTDVTEYFYDNAGNRFIKVSPAGTTVYLRHGQIAVAMDIELPVDTTEELGRTNRYVLSGDLLAGRITTIVPAVGEPTEEKSYYHLDHLNSTKCVTDEDGVVVVMYKFRLRRIPIVFNRGVYRAFGEQLKRLDSNGDETGDEAKYSYGGKELADGTNLYYFNARYYDATIGRFINVDPVQDGSNWYVYCNNNPLCFVDPTGLEDKNIISDTTTKTLLYDNLKIENVIGYLGSIDKSAKAQEAVQVWTGLISSTVGMVKNTAVSTGAGLVSLANSAVPNSNNPVFRNITMFLLVDMLAASDKNEYFEKSNFQIIQTKREVVKKTSAFYAGYTGATSEVFETYTYELVNTSTGVSTDITGSNIFGGGMLLNKDVLDNIVEEKKIDAVTGAGGGSVEEYNNNIKNTYKPEKILED